MREGVLMRVVETDVLVVGAGPAGLTLSAFLARENVEFVTVTKYNGTANSPRAHITNQRTVEVLRDLGVEDAVMAEALPQNLMGQQVYSTSFAGKEICRMMTWGGGLERRADYESASPSMMCNAPQHLLEPIILESALERGADIRFGTELVHLEQDEAGVRGTVRVRDTGREYEIRAKYAVGCDGAGSTVADQIGFPIEGEMGVGDAFTVWLEADLTKYTKHRSGALFFVCEPGSDIWLSAWTCVRPWTEWNPLFIRHGQGPAETSEEAVLARVRSAIGDPSVEVTIKKISSWKLNNAVAGRYRIGRVFLAGDAAHRHSPANGLGSNTCIQDAYNLAWKLSYVLSGRAGDGLLETYHDERYPVGKQVIGRANRSVAEMKPFTDAVGFQPGQSVEQAWANLDELFSGTEVGSERRERLAASLVALDGQFNAHGVELGQRYESAAVVGDGTEFPPYERDPELYYHPTTYPGAFLPHTWIEHGGRRMSTLDLARGGRFALLTGPGGEEWLKVAASVGEEMGVEIRGRVIGLRQEADDVFGDWARRREISDGGCILIRPDGYIAWRSHDAVDDPYWELRRVMSMILDHPTS